MSTLLGVFVDHFGLIFNVPTLLTNIQASQTSIYGKLTDYCPHNRDCKLAAPSGLFKYDIPFPALHWDFLSNAVLKNYNLLRYNMFSTSTILTWYSAVLVMQDFTGKRVIRGKFQGPTLNRSTVFCVILLSTKCVSSWWRPHGRSIFRIIQGYRLLSAYWRSWVRILPVPIFQLEERP